MPTIVVEDGKNRRNPLRKNGKSEDGWKIYERATSVLYPLELENEEDPPDDEAARTEELNKRNKSNENNKKTTERRKRYYFRSKPDRGDEKRREKIEEE